MLKLSEIIKGTVLLFACTLFSANATIISWADWTSGTSTQVEGTFTTPTSSVDITYTNAQGIAFLQTGVGTDFFKNTESASVSPYTGDIVENIPTAAEMIGLSNAGTQTLSFSETVANPFFSYVSLNGNGYAFDQDFDILSFGDSTDGNNCGYWGCGTSYKQIVDIGNGVMEYRLLGTGEPHGTIKFKGAFDTMSWRSMSSEYWNGFTVGIEGTADEVFVPEPTTLSILSLALLGMVSRRRRKL